MSVLNINWQIAKTAVSDIYLTIEDVDFGGEVTHILIHSPPESTTRQVQWFNVDRQIALLSYLSVHCFRREWENDITGEAVKVWGRHVW